MFANINISKHFYTYINKNKIYFNFYILKCVQNIKVGNLAKNKNKIILFNL